MPLTLGWTFKKTGLNLNRLLLEILSKSCQKIVPSLAKKKLAKPKVIHHRNIIMLQDATCEKTEKKKIFNLNKILFERQNEAEAFENGFEKKI